MPIRTLTPLDRLDQIASKSSRTAWVAQLVAHGVAADDAGLIVATYQGEGQRLRIDHDIALAQAVHETGWFRSAHWIDDHDPAGLGVVSPDAQGNRFASPQEGITAHLEHLCCYAYRVTECPADHAHLKDQRHFFHDGRPLLRDLIRPERRWADPGTGYIDAICAIANQVLGGNNVPTPVPTSQDIGYPVRVHWASDVGPDRPLSDVHWFVVHDTEGGLAGSEAILTAPTDPVASAHALIDVDGACVFMVPLTATAWTAGNDEVSRQSIEVELVGFASGVYTEAQYRSLANFYQWCTSQGMSVPATYIGRVATQTGDPWLPGTDGIIGHQDVPNGAGGWGGVSGHTDPGPHFDWAKLVGYINAAPAPQPQDPYLHLNGFIVGGGFRTIYESVKYPLQTFGLPLSDELQANVTDADGTKHQRTVQFFERAVFQFEPENEDPWRVTCVREDQMVEAL